MSSQNNSVGEVAGAGGGAVMVVGVATVFSALGAAPGAAAAARAASSSGGASGGTFAVSCQSAKQLKLAANANENSNSFFMGLLGRLE